jgi:hypothetical protein
MARKRGRRRGHPAFAKRPSTMKTSPDDTPSLPQVTKPSTSEITDQLPEAAITFQLFLKLPPEIRFMV